MMLEIDGVGRVEVDDAFKSLSPEEQDRTVQEIAAQAKGESAAPEATDEAGRGFLPHLAQGFATTAGAASDIPNVGLSAVGMGSEEPFLGSKHIQSGVEALGGTLPTEGPESLGEYAGQGAGMALGALPMVLGPARMMMGAASPIARGVGQTVMRPFMATPGRAVTAEALGGAGVEVGMELARRSENEAVQSPLGQFAAGVVGSLGAAAGPSAAVQAGKKLANLTPLGWALKGVRAAIFPFTEAGGKVRASRRLRDLSADPKATARRLDEPSIGNLTPAQQSGEDRLMALERAILDKDAKLDADFKKRTAESSAALKEAVREPAEGLGPEEVQQFVGERLNYLTSLLDQRVMQAQESAAQRLAKLTPENRVSQNASIVRAELEAAKRAARAQERQLWNAVPQEMIVPTDNIMSAYSNLRDSLSRAQKSDMPGVARRLLGNVDEATDEDDLAGLLRRVFGEEPPIKNAPEDKFGVEESVKEMVGLRSKLLDEARKARANKDFNTARLADNLGDAILDDLAEADDGMIATARGFSRALNERFRQGDIGRILGTEREGGARVAPEMTLDITLGRGGTKAAVSADDLRQAIAPIKGQAGAPDPQAAEAAMRDYLRRRFTDYSVRNGEMDPKRAEDFVRKNDELLDRFPDLKQQMAEGQVAQTQAQRTTRTAGERSKRLRDPRQSKTAAVLNADPEKVIETVVKSRSPREAARDLRRQVGKDETGEAMAGLKGSFFDFLMSKAQSSAIDEAGETVLSGRAFQRLLKEPRVRAAATEILTTKEFKRLERITQELRGVEASQGRLPNVGAPMEDVPNKLISFVTRTLAARMGAQAGAGTSGASLLTAHFASKRMREFIERLTNDQAEALLRDAIQDKDLFQSLLMGVDTPRTAKKVERRLIEWLAGYSGAQAGGEDENR